MKNLYVDVIYNQRKKSVFKAYLFWLFLGSIGAHKFYTDKPRWGWTYAALFFGGLLTAGFSWIALFDLILADIFIIPGKVESANESIHKSVRALAVE